MGLMAVMNADKGDVKTTWNPGNPDEVEAARKQFDTLRKKGYMAYKVTGERRGALIRAFDPAAGKIILAPAMQGG